MPIDYDPERKKIDGQEAYRISLVSELVPIATIRDRAQALGDALAAQP